MKRICVFCGSRPGVRPAYTEAAEDFAGLLVERGIQLVFGGAEVGLMGRLADTVMSEGGQAIGVIPQALVEREIAHRRITELHVVDSMHERKAKMAELSDAFVALPGGLGTLDELFEVFTWVQLGLHAKPCALLNIEGYYDDLVAFLDRAVDEGFLTEANRGFLLVEDDQRVLLDRLEHFEPGVRQRQWIDRGEV